MAIDCELSTPKDFQGNTPTTSSVFWNYSKMICEYNDEKVELIENATTGQEFFLDKTFSYGDFLIGLFLIIFVVFGIAKFLMDFLIPKRMNFKR